MQRENAGEGRGSEGGEDEGGGGGDRRWRGWHCNPSSPHKRAGNGRETGGGPGARPVGDDAVELVGATDQHVDAVLLLLCGLLCQRAPVPASVARVTCGSAWNSAVEAETKLSVILLRHRDLLQLVNPCVERRDLLCRVVPLQDIVAAHIELKALRRCQTVVRSPADSRGGA